MTFEELFNKTVEFKDFELLEYKKGFIRFKTTVNESDTNPYNKAHGGYLYTLCDDLSGLVGYSLGYYVVTIQSSISYLKQIDEGETITVTGKAIHSGKSTDVVEVTIENEEGTTAVKAQITLFNVREVDKI